MAVNLDTLVVDLTIDSGQFDAGIDKALKKAEKGLKKLNNFKFKALKFPTIKAPRVGGSTSRIKIDTPSIDFSIDKITSELNNLKSAYKDVLDFMKDNPLRPTADHSELTKLNEHIEEKRTHAREVNRFLQDNPLTVGKQTDGTRSGRLSTRVSSADNVLDQIGDVLAQPLKSALTGVFERLGEKVTDVGSSVVGRSLQRGGVDPNAVVDRLADSLNSVIINLNNNYKPDEQTKSLFANFTPGLGAGNVQPFDPTQFNTEVDAVETAYIKAFKAAKASANRINQEGSLPALPGQDQEISNIDRLKFQAQSSSQFLKDVYADFKDAQKEFKKLETTLSRVKPGEILPDDVADMAAQSVLRVRDLASKVVTAAAAAKRDIEVLLRTNKLTDAEKASVTGRKGSISRNIGTATTTIQRSQRFTTQPTNEAQQSVAKAYKEIGKEVDAALRISLQTAEMQAKQRGKSIGKNLSQSTKRELGIQSPSRVFISIGRDVNRGLRNGLQDGDKIAKAYVQNVTKALKGIKGAGNLEEMQSEYRNLVENIQGLRLHYIAKGDIDRAEMLKRKFEQSATALRALNDSRRQGEQLDVAAQRAAIRNAAFDPINQRDRMEDRQLVAGQIAKAQRLARRGIPEGAQSVQELAKVQEQLNRATNVGERSAGLRQLLEINKKMVDVTDELLTKQQLLGQQEEIQTELERSTLKAQSKAINNAKKDIKDQKEKNKLLERENDLRSRSARPDEPEFFAGRARRGYQEARRRGEAEGYNPADFDTLEQNVPNIGQLITAVATAWNPASIPIASLAPLIVPALPAIVAGVGIGRLMSPIMARVEAALQSIEPIVNRLEFVGGGTQAAGGAELDFVTGISKEYGLDLGSAAEQYAQLAAASRGSRLEGEKTKEIFEGIATSLAAMKLSAADSSLVLQAYTQIIAKGQLSMEELRQQLGEKFPPAMQVFAKAMGVTVPEMIRMISAGSVLSEDIMPKVAKVLKEDFSQAAKEAADSYAGLVNSLNTERFIFDKNLMEAFGAIPKFIKQMQIAGLRAINDNTKAFQHALQTGVISIGAVLFSATAQILQMQPIAKATASIQSFLVSAFSGAMPILSVFLVTAFADMLEEVFSVESTFIENMMTGFTNLFALPLAPFVHLGKAIFPEDMDAKMNEIGESMNPIVAGIQKIIGLVPKGLVEFTVMFVMLQQSGVLLRFMSPTINKIGKAFFDMGKAVSATFTQMKNLKSIGKGLTPLIDWSKTMIASMAQLGIQVAATFLMMSLAASKFRSDLDKTLTENTRNIVRNIRDLKEAQRALDEGGIATDGEAAVAQESIGLQLNPANFLKFGGQSYTTADFTEDFINKEPSWLGKFLNPAWAQRTAATGQSAALIERGFGAAADLGIDSRVIAQLAEKRSLTANDRALISDIGTLADTITAANLAMESLGLTVDNLEAGNLPRIFEEPVSKIEALDAEIEQLTGTRVTLMEVDTDEARSEVEEIDARIKDLIDSREKEQRALTAQRESIISQRSGLEAIRAKTLTDTTKTEGQRRAIAEALQTEIDKLDLTIELLDKNGVADALREIPNIWRDTVSQIAESQRMFARDLSNLKVQRAEALTDIISSQATGFGQRDQLTTRLQEAIAGEDALRIELDLSEQNLEERKEQLAKLMAVAGSLQNQDMKKEIEKLRSEIMREEENVANLQLRVVQERQKILLQEERLAAAQLKAAQAASEIGSSRAMGLLGLEKLDTQIAVAGLKINRTLAGLDTQFVGLGTNLELTNKRMSILADQRSSRLQNLEGFSADAKQWFISQLQRPVASFGEAIQSVTVEEIGAIRSSLGNASDNPLAQELLRQAEGVAKISKDIKSTRLQALNEELQILSQMQQIKDSIKSFNDRLVTELQNVQTEIENLEFDNTAKKLKNQLNNLIEPGSEGNIRNFLDFVGGIADTAAGNAKEELSLAQEAAESARQIQNLRQEFGTLAQQMRDAREALARVQEELNRLAEIENQTEAVQSNTEAFQQLTDKVKEATGAIGGGGLAGGTSGQPVVVQETAQAEQKKQQVVNLLNELTKERNSRVEQINRIFDKRQEFTSANNAITDLAYGQAYDISRFEGSLPGVTPANNDQNWRNTFMEMDKQTEVLRQQVSEIETLRDQVANEGIGLDQTTLDDFGSITKENTLSASNQNIDRLEAALARRTALKAEGLDLEKQAQLFQATDEMRKALKGVSEELRGFAQSIDSSKSSIIDFAREYGVSTDLISSTSGLTDAGLRARGEADKLDEIANNIREAFGLERLNQNARNVMITSDEVSIPEADLSSLEGFELFSGVIQDYRDGLIDAGEAAVMMSQDLAKTSRELNRISEEALAEEARRKAFEVQQATLDLQSRLAGFRNTQVQGDIGADLFDVNAAKRASEELSLRRQITEEVEKAYLLLQKRDISQETYNEVLAGANQHYAVMSEQIEFNNSLMGQLALDAKNSLTSAFSDFFKGNKSGWEALRDFGLSILDSIADKAASLAVSSIFDGLFGGNTNGGGGGLIGGLLGGLFGGGGMVPTYNMGGMVSTARYGRKTPNAKYGIEAMQMGSEVLKAMNIEGTGAVPIVAHAGEHILSDRTGDAQLYSALQESGDWMRMKSGVGTFNYGGSVMNPSQRNADYIRQQQRNNSVSSTMGGNVYMTVNTPNADSFRKSKTQICREKQREMEKAKRRNR